MPFWDYLHRIGFRLALFLTVALLPLGLIAVWQTRQVAEEIEQRSRLTLTALTQQAAQAERRVIERGFGASEVLAVVAQQTRDNPALCSALFRRYLEATPEHKFAGFVTADARMSCSSDPGVAELSASAVIQHALEDPQRRVMVDFDPVSSPQPVIMVTLPVYDQGAYIGSVLITTPRRVLEFNFEPIHQTGPINVVTFNVDGEIIGTNGDFDRSFNALPLSRDLQDFVGSGMQTFRAAARDGMMHSYAVVPIVPNVAYAVGTWEGRQANGTVNTVIPAYAFPIIMWLTSLAVAYFAVHRVVIKHIRHLQREMRAFALHRQLPTADKDNQLPTEIAEMHRTFIRTAGILLRDEADLENAVQEQKVLLKEVHHRVKNNLQLISSIMSMQMRKVKSRETRIILRRLQDRVLGLATIHRNLYQSDSLSRVRADNMISDVADQMVLASVPPDGNVAVTLDLDPIALYPDQIVPLSLLASEALTNALKNLGSPEGREPHLRVALKQEDEDHILLAIENSLGNPVLAADPSDPIPEGDGLGGRLIAAFAGQLGARLESGQDQDVYRLTARFASKPFAEDASAGQSV